MIWVYIMGSMIDYIVDDRTQKRISGDSAYPEEFRELWKFILTPQGWVLDEICQTTTEKATAILRTPIDEHIQLGHQPEGVSMNDSIDIDRERAIERAGAKLALLVLSRVEGKHKDENIIFREYHLDVDGGQFFMADGAEVLITHDPIVGIEAANSEQVAVVNVANRKLAEYG